MTDPLSVTHDANAWPADRYAGLPAPAPGERVVLWVQNSHPIPIPAGAIGLNPMGDERVVPIGEPIAPFASRAVDVAELLPDLAWPQQIELRAGKHMVRPRYEVIDRGRRRIAHVNVERTDLLPDPNLPSLAERARQGLSAARPGPAARRPGRPLCCRRRWRFASGVADCRASSTTGRGTRFCAVPWDGCRAGTRSRSISTTRRGSMRSATATAMSSWSTTSPTAARPTAGCTRSFATAQRESGHAAETSFGAHVFNTILTYRDEPQSYTGRPPGLSTRLFLRLGEAATTRCAT